MKKHYISTTRNQLIDVIDELNTNASLFVKNPSTDFTRNRKLPLDTLAKMILGMSGKSMNKELLNYFDFSTDAPSPSAFNQQRSKVLPEAFEFIFHEFTKQLKMNRLFKGYRLIACDGSNLTIAPNPDDLSTRVLSNQYGRCVNRLHLNAFYDILNRSYLDVIIQHWQDLNEYHACKKMIDRSSIDENVLFLADRGYENYSILAHLNEKNWKYLIRVKDIKSNGIASSLGFSEFGDLDKKISMTLTRQQSKCRNNNNYKHISSTQHFDYIPKGSLREYSLQFRVARFLIADNTYETVITNLDEEEFSSSELKELYHLRWGIESSFRELKYAVGLLNLHAKKVDYIKQEIFACLTTYNYCEAIITHTLINHKKKKNLYQVNFTLAIFICKVYLNNEKKIKPPDIELLIKRNILPVRPGRHDPRKVNRQKPVSFLYRVA
jgi:hypothetical protein